MAICMRLYIIEIPKQSLHITMIQRLQQSNKIHDLPCVQLFEQKDLQLLNETAKSSRDTETHKIVSNLIHMISSKGNIRVLKALDSEYRKNLLDMREDFPNFLEVIDYISYYAELAWHTDRVLRFTPILLSGPGGVGKTRFAEALAKWCTSSFHRISIAASQNGSELAGSSAFWANSSPGVIFNLLVQKDYANPLVFLDEIDKSSTDGRYDVLGPLYILLEPSSAKEFSDQCYQLPLDASHVMYIAACNTSERIPAPLRTRFREFQISITREQSLTIARKIATQALERFQPATTGITFSENAIESMAQLTPRKIEQWVTECIGRALLIGTNTIDFQFDAVPKLSRIGFIP